MNYSLVYMLVPVFFIFLFMIPKEIGKASYGYFVVLLCPLFLTFFLGLRGFIATDWYLYYKGINDIPPLFDFNNAMESVASGFWEKGFVFFVSIIKCLCEDYFFVQFFSFLFDLVILLTVMKRTISREFYPLFFCLFFVFQGFIIETNLLRNSKSIMLFLLSITVCLKTDRFKALKYIVINLIGMLFHSSSLVYIFLYPFIFYFKPKPKYLILIFCIGLFIYVLKVQWIASVLSFISPIFYGSRIYRLFITYGIIGGKFSSYSFGIGFLERILTFVLLIRYTRKYKDAEDFVLKLPFLNCLFLFLCISLYLSEISVILDRFSMLFVVGYWFFYIFYYEKLNKSKRKIFLFILTLYCLLKMLVQCDEPIYKYRNCLIDSNDYYSCARVFDKNDKE